MNFNHSPFSCETGRVIYFLQAMKWKNKANEIADALLSKMEASIDGSYSRDAVHNNLQKAALEGMEWELENWVLKRQ